LSRDERPTDAGLKFMLEAGEIEDEALPPGSRIGRYVVLETVGTGGMSIVYKAYDPQLDRAIALKVMLPRAQGEGLPEARERLLREAQALARVSHPNIISVYDCGPFGNQVFVAMELVSGLTLSEWRRVQARTPEQILAVFLQAGRGLAAAHAAGLIHRDFKPANVIVGDDGRVRVLDFGLARAVDQATASRQQPEPLAAAPGHASVSAVRGTPAYMAPEQHLHGTATARSDQFSFCVALYEALYGEPPFAGATAEELARAVTTGRVRPPSGSQVPGWLRPIVLRGLAVAPEERHDSMEQLLAALARSPRSLRPRLLGALAGAALLAAGTALGVFWLARDQPRCRDLGNELRGIWDPPTRQAVQRAFTASGRPTAAATYDRVARLLDGQAADWLALRTELCRSGQRSELDRLRAHCLGQRRSELRTLVERFTAADARIVDGAVHAAFELPSVRMCADATALRAGAGAAAAPAPVVDPRGCGLPPRGRYNPVEIGRTWVYRIIDKSTRRPLDTPKVTTVEALARVGGCKGDTIAYRLRGDTEEGYAYRWQEVREVPSPPGQRPGVVTVRHRDTWFTAGGQVTKDEYFAPGRIRLDESCLHTQVGASYLDSYDEVEVASHDGCGEEKVRRPRTFDWRVVGSGVPIVLELDYRQPACCPGTRPPCRPPPDDLGHQCSPVVDNPGRYRCEFSTLHVERREVGGGDMVAYWFAPEVGKVLEDSKGDELEELICFTIPPPR
jgi:hypothetical protein